MKKMIGALSIFALLIGFVTPVMAADDEDQYEQKVKHLNSLGDKPGKMKVALQRISTETGVPLDRVEAQHKRHPEMGVAALMLANVMSADTKKQPSYFFEQRKAGKKWLTLAKENNIPVDRLNERLDRLEKAIKG